ncbi:MAG TPA: aromatic-ring-hydroxylating dioxygenase subunit beta [Stellaceae bacterium]|nr:aromatic-ring-hydroxylating dioxygenase subunit beta [Stellaceae bacterium]
MTVEASAFAAEFLYREALYLDRRQWDAWLALYHEDAEFWVPAWKNEEEPTADPATEISLLYTSKRSELEDRVWRVRSGRSIASVPLPRTAHNVTNVLALEGRDGTLEVTSNWTIEVFNVKRRDEHVFYTRCEHLLVRAEQGWRIRRRKAILLNDTLPTMMDFYTI